jgi:hypothetical protein
MAISFDQKNKNILSRFETTSTGSAAKKYTVNFSDGTNCIMICVNGETQEQAARDAVLRFGIERVADVKA